MSSRAIITLTTDYGLHDPYVGQMKGAILSLAPDAQVVDITHDVAPQAVVEGAFVLETSWRFFPQGTIHVVVVDPGVGTSRRRLIVSSGGHIFVGPDNGCLSAALPATTRGLRGLLERYLTKENALDPATDVHMIERIEGVAPTPSVTFEGRDVFGPVAALLASGRRASEFGPRAPSAQVLPMFRAPVSGGGVFGQVVRVDRFGNLITDIRGEDMPQGSRFKIGDRDLPMARTYAEAAGPSAVVGSAGYVEIAVPYGNAAQSLGAGVGEAVMGWARV